MVKTCSVINASQDIYCS